jgi:acylpyruvate hydrolase
MDKIVCVGKNYSDHVKEMAQLAGDAPPEKPVLFIKPPSVLRSAERMGDQINATLPPDSGEAHHECELVLRLNRDGYRLSLEEARLAIGEVSLGLDMTLRDTQTKLKKLGQPWEIGKVFLDSAIVGPFVPVSGFPEYLETPFEFHLDGVLKQRGFGKDMIFKPAECVAYLSEHFPLKAGDLVFTGTPSGVGPVRAGQIGRLSWGERVNFSVRWNEFQR